jgi:hypothetical protein
MSLFCLVPTSVSKSPSMPAMGEAVEVHLSSST